MKTIKKGNKTEVHATIDEIFDNLELVCQLCESLDDMQRLKFACMLLNRNIIEKIDDINDKDVTHSYIKTEIKLVEKILKNSYNNYYESR